MNLAALQTQLTKSLGDSAESFQGEQIRLINIALTDYSRYRPLTLAASVRLQAGKQRYPVPENFIGFKHSLWGKSALPLWSTGRPHNIPRPQSLSDALQFQQPITPAHIQHYGANYAYLYFAKHQILDNGDLTLSGDHDLLVMRAQAQAMLELALHNADKQPAAHQHIGNQSSNSKPMHIHDTLMAAFKARLNA